MSQLVSSGPIALKDLGTNTTSNIQLDSGAGGLSLSSDTAFSLNRAYQAFYDGEINAWEYSNDVIVDGTAYVYKRSSTSAYHDSGHSAYLYQTTGYNADIGTNLVSYMSSVHATGQAYVGNVGLNASSSSTLGSLSSTKQSYTSLNGDTRTISDIGYVQNTNSNTGNGAVQDKGNLIWFGLTGNVSNNDNDAFYLLSLYNSNGNGVTGLLRSAATRRYDGNVTIWTWDSISDSSMNTLSTSVNRFILTTSSSTTITNGISEEMSGGTDTNPIEFSDYYKDGIYHNTTGIPTSGELQFSDFYGKTRQGVGGTSIHSTAWVGEAFWNYVAFSGFWANGGSMTDTTFTLNGSSVTISILYQVSGTTYFTVSGLQSNSGWSNLKIWVNQSNNSGTPTYTLTRSSASHSQNSNNNTTSWSWASTPSGTSYAYSPTSSGSTYNNYLVID